MIEENKPTETRIEVKQGERSYYFVCPPDSPLGEAYDAVCTMRAYIVERINEHAKVNVQEPEMALEQEDEAVNA